MIYRVGCKNNKGKLEKIKVEGNICGCGQLNEQNVLLSRSSRPEVVSKIFGNAKYLAKFKEKHFFFNINDFTHTLT